MTRILKESKSALRRRRVARGGKAPALEAILRTRTIFVHVPKCGGKTVIRDLYGLGEHEYFGHADMGFYRALLGPRRVAAFRSFAVLRDPIARCRSGYRFLRQGGFGLEGDREMQDAIGARRFEEFVLDGTLHRLAARDVVFRPQADFVADDGGAVDDLLDFAHFESELKRRGIGRDDGVSRVNASSSPDVAPVSPEVARTIRDLYDRDYALLRARLS